MHPCQEPHPQPQATLHEEVNARHKDKETPRQTRTEPQLQPSSTVSSLKASVNEAVELIIRMRIMFLANDTLGVSILVTKTRVTLLKVSFCRSTPPSSQRSRREFQQDSGVAASDRSTTSWFQDLRGSTSLGPKLLPKTSLSHAAKFTRYDS